MGHGRPIGGSCWWVVVTSVGGVLPSARDRIIPGLRVYPIPYHVYSLTPDRVLPKDPCVCHNFWGYLTADLRDFESRQPDRS